MDGEEGGGIRLSKRFDDKAGSGEVDYKTKSGTAWSHSFLNQKPWHPLSYPNQRRKWIAEQTHAQREKRAEEVAREYSQEQEFFRQTALVSKKEKEKMEMMKAVSFMYIRPPGYDAESAKAAEVAEERRKEQGSMSQPEDGPSTAMPPESMHVNGTAGEMKKKPRSKDVFGRALPTEEEFEILKNAPRMETGAPARVKPFGIEVRNVKCLRCGTFGHQSGDRECPLKDAIMPNEESRLKRDDPLSAIIAQIDPTEPLKWELKQKPGLSPPRGGFKPDDPNQQIVAEEIFDEYGGFLSGGIVPELLTNFSSKPKKRKSEKKKKHRRQSSVGLSSSSDDDGEKSKEKKHKKKKHDLSKSNASDDSDFDRRQRKSRHKHSYMSEEDEFAKHREGKKSRQKHSYSSEDPDTNKHSRRKRSRKIDTHLSEDGSDSSEHSEPGRYRSRREPSYLFEEDPDSDKQTRGKKSRQKHSSLSEDSDSDKQNKSKRKKEKHAHLAGDDSDKHGHKHSYRSEDFDLDRHHKSKKSRQKDSYSSEDSDQNKSKRSRKKRSYPSKDSDSDKQNRSRRSNQRHTHVASDKPDLGSHKHSSRSEVPSRNKEGRQVHSYSSEQDFERHQKSELSSHKRSHSRSYDDTETYADRRRSKHSSHR